MISSEPGQAVALPPQAVVCSGKQGGPYVRRAPQCQEHLDDD